MKEKPTWRIIKTLSEDYCIIEENTKEHSGVKLVSFDDLETGNIIWDARQIEAQMKEHDRSMQQKVSQMNKGKK